MGTRSITNVGAAKPWASLLPAGPDVNGSWGRAYGQQATRMLLFNALGDCESTNPFQGDIGLGEGYVFNVQSAELRGALELRIRTILGQFERAGLAKLIGIRWSAVGEDLFGHITYQDIPSGNMNTIALDLNRES